MRELLDNSRSEKVSTNKAPIEFAKNPQLPETATTSGAESQSGSIMELWLIVVGENVNEDGRRGARVRVEKIGQDLEECNPEFLIIERQF